VLKSRLGMAVGAVLGLLDGLSAWAYPEARPMMAAIVVGSTLKGLVTGLLASFVANRVRSMPLGVSLGVLFGWLLSTVAAAGQGEHYWPIVLPGMLVGAVVGFVTQRYPREDRMAATGQNRSVLLLALALAVGAGTALAQDSEQNSLASLEFLVGEWEGTSEGQPGSGVVRREYARILGGRFMQVRNTTTYAPQAKNPKGEQHEDIGFFSFDRIRKRLVLRQFHVEGFVNEYVAEGASGSERMVFTTESIENIPPGWRARETYIRISADELEERFELAEPGKDYELYSRSRLKRVRR
jgi:hypothetical protein